MRLTAKLILIFVLVGVIPLLLGGAFLLYSFDAYLGDILPPEKLDGSASFLQEIVGGYIAFSIVLLLPITLTSFFLSREITRPLKDISLAAKKVARGNFKARAEVSGKDEFGELAENFNKMTKDLGTLREDLEEKRNILEVKVKARTRELEEMNETLESQVKERTREMEKKLEEFEKMSKLMVGRELRMKEMKKELKQTKEELEKLKKETGGDVSDK